MALPAFPQSLTDDRFQGSHRDPFDTEETMPRPDRSAHHLFEGCHREVDARLHRRLTEIAEALDLAPPLRLTFLAACERAAHLHSADCARVNYEFRSGRGASAEDELRREALHEEQWLESLGVLRDAATKERKAAEAEAMAKAPAPRFRVKYQPLASITKPLG